MVGVKLLLLRAILGLSPLPLPSFVLTFNNLELCCGPPASITISETPVEAGILGGEPVEDDCVGTIAWLFKQRKPALILFLNQTLALHQQWALAI